MAEPRRRSSSVGLIAAVGVAVNLTTGAPVVAQQAAPIIPPVRHRPPPTVVVPPLVPATAEALAPMTLTVTTRWERAGRAPRMTRQVVVRTVDRVLVSVSGTESEWFFERNPIDHRRVSGFLVDHTLRRILIHHESDLRNGQQIRGWRDVLTLRFDADTLKTLQATGETETANDVTFTRYVERGTSTAPGIAEVWWSETLLFARRVIVRDAKARITSTVESFENGVDESKLASPATRFPSYRVLDVTDAREP